MKWGSNAGLGQKLLDSATLKVYVSFKDCGQSEYWYDQSPMAYMVNVPGNDDASSMVISSNPGDINRHLQRLSNLNVVERCRIIPRVDGVHGPQWQTYL